MRLPLRVALCVLLACEAMAQRGGGVGAGNIGRVPNTSGWPRVPSGPPPIGQIAPERRTAGLPFKGPVAFPPADRQWIRVETPHFSLISSAPERKTRVIAEDFERLTALLVRTSAFFRVAPQRTQVFVFNDRRDALPYFDAVRGVRVDATGITFRYAEGTTMLLDTGAKGGDIITPRHELIHDLLRRGERALPLWIEEGLAEYYSNAGMPIREHVSRMRGKRMPMSELFAIHGESPRAASFDFYAQSWAAVATLMRRDERLFFELLDDLGAGIPPADALRARYAMSVADFEVAMRKAGAPATSLLMQPVPISFEVTPVARPQLLYELGVLLARVKGREDEAERHFKAVIELQPAHMAACLAYAELLAPKRERAAEARAFAERAMAHEAPRAHAAIGLAYLAEENKSSAREYLERAIEGAPERVALPLFSIYLDTGERASADILFTRIAATPRVNDARRLLLKIDIPRADALAREGKLLEAARILRDLAPKMPDKTRANLEMQAAGLEAAAAAPR